MGNKSFTNRSKYLEYKTCLDELSDAKSDKEIYSKLDKIDTFILNNICFFVGTKRIDISFQNYNSIETDEQFILLCQKTFDIWKMRNEVQDLNLYVLKLLQVKSSPFS